MNTQTKQQTGEGNAPREFSQEQVDAMLNDIETCDMARQALSEGRIKVTGEGNAPRFPKYLCDNEKAAGGRMIRAEYPDAGVPELQQRFNDALNAYENIETKDSFCTFLGKFWLTGEGMRQAKAPQTHTNEHTDS